MELEGYSRPTYNKLVHSAMTRSTVLSVIHKLTVDEFADQRVAVAKFSKSKMQKWVALPWSRPLGKQLLIGSLMLHMVNPYTNFESLALAIPKILHEVQTFKMDHVTLTMPLLGMIFHRQTKTCYEKWCKMKKLGWFGAVRGNSSSHSSIITSYSTLIETIYLVPFLTYLLKLADFNIRHLHFGAGPGVNPVKFHGHLWH